MNGHRPMTSTSSKRDMLMSIQIDFAFFLGRILTDVPCKVCRDNSSGKHYGIFACDG